MPASSQTQARTARVAMGIKHGDINPHSLPPGLRKAAESMAQMSEEQLKDFMYTKKKRKSLVASMILCCLLLPALVLAQGGGPRGGTLQDGTQSSGNGTPIRVEGYSVVGLTVIGSSGADRVVNWEATQDGTNYVGISCQNRASLAIATTATATSTTAQLWTCPVAGMQQFRARLSGGSTGTVTVTATALPMVSQVLRSGDSIALPGSYTIGDLLYANSANSVTNLADVASGSYLRSGGVGAAPVWSTLTLPNAATTGDLLQASGSNAVGTLADVAAGSYLRSGGVGAAAGWSTTTLPNSATTGDLVFASGSNAYGNLAAVASGQVLASAGTSTAPAYTANPSVTSASVTGSYKVNNVLLCSATAPTISSGFGTSPSIANNNGTCAFTVNVGTGGTATSGVIGLPTATTGWVVNCTDLTTNSATVFVTKQTATTTTTATVGNFNTSATAAAWAASDVLRCSAHAY